MNVGQFFAVLAHNLNLATPQLRLEQLQRVVEYPMDVEVNKLRRVAGAREIQKVSNNVSGAIGLKNQAEIMLAIA